MKTKQNIEELISQTLKRHNGHRLVLLIDGQYAVIYPKKEVIRLGSSRSSALSTWYSYWKSQKK